MGAAEAWVNRQIRKLQQRGSITGEGMTTPKWKSILRHSHHEVSGYFQLAGPSNLL